MKTSRNMRSVFRIAESGGLWVAILWFVYAPISTAQKKIDLDEVAREMTEAIQTSTGASNQTKVLVVDFSEPKEATQFGIALAEEFADRLRIHAKHFTVLDRHSVDEATKENKLPVGALSS